MTTRVLSSVPAALPSFGRSATAAAAAVTSRCVDVVGLSRVKRCLFADAVATATLAATAQQQRDDALQAAALELRRQVVHDSQRWNFDFVNDAPLPGRFVWADAIAKATPKAAPTPTTPAPASSSSSETRMRQAHITDFLQPRKRSLCSSSSSSGSKRLRLHDAGGDASAAAAASLRP